MSAGVSFRLAFGLGIVFPVTSHICHLDELSGE